MTPQISPPRSWIDHVDGATYLRKHAPRLFDAVIEPFMQYTTLGDGDYGLAVAALESV